MTDSPNTESLVVPPLGAILAYRGVYALATVNKDTGRLRATHYATCLVGGREPWWGVWTVNGVFQRFFSSKEQVQKAYPKLVWRRKNATWSMVRIDDMDAKAKKAELAVLFKKGETRTDIPVAALFADGEVRAWSETFRYRTDTRPLFTHEMPLPSEVT